MGLLLGLPFAVSLLALLPIAFGRSQSDRHDHEWVIETNQYITKDRDVAYLLICRICGGVSEKVHTPAGKSAGNHPVRKTETKETRTASELTDSFEGEVATSGSSE